MLYVATLTADLWIHRTEFCRPAMWYAGDHCSPGIAGEQMGLFKSTPMVGEVNGALHPKTHYLGNTDFGSRSNKQKSSDIMGCLKLPASTLANSEFPTWKNYLGPFGLTYPITGLSGDACQYSRGIPTSTMYYLPTHIHPPYKSCLLPPDPPGGIACKSANLKLAMPQQSWELPRCMHCEHHLWRKDDSQ